MTTQDPKLAVLWRGALFAGLIAVLSTAGCGQNAGRISGKMFVPRGLQGSAKWGEVWLLRNYQRVRNELKSHERILVLALLGKDAEFMRRERDKIMEIGAINEKLAALNRREVPVSVEMPPRISITAMTSLDSLVSGITVRTRPATDTEVATGELTGMKAELTEQAVQLRESMEPSIRALQQQRADQKMFFLSDADGLARQHRLRQVDVRMDGNFTMNEVPLGEYGLYGRYVLISWFEMTPVVVRPGLTHQDIPRLPTVIQESSVIVSLDAIINLIRRM